MTKLTILALASIATGCGSGSNPADDTPDPEPTDWCERIAAGPASTAPAALALADAHFAYRYFGDAPRESVDAPLSAAFAGGGATVDVDAYAAAAIDVCARPAATAGLTAATVELRGDVAWIHPGTGAVSVPAGAAALAIDLRGLPDDPALTDALAAATTAALAAPLPRPALETTRYDGHPDSYFLRLSGIPASGDIYSTAIARVARDPWPGTATRALPVAVIADVAMAPAAAELALDLRRAGRAMLVGHTVVTQVAETTWRAVGDRGLAIRVGRLVDGTTPVPDLIDADLRTDDPDAALAAASAITSVAALQGGDATRAAPRALVFYDWPAVGSIATPDIKAALAVAYGTAHGFFAIYDTWQTGVDDAYLAGLAEADTAFTRRDAVRAVLERFTAALHDAHVGVVDLARDATSNEFTGVIPVGFDVVDGAPVVATSALPTLAPGDTIITVDGAPVADFLAPYGARISAATPSNHAVNTASFLGYLTSANRTFGVRAADGATRDVVVNAGTTYPPFGPQRTSGWLTDIGAPEVYYLNINGLGGPDTSEAELLAMLDDARTGTGVVIDGRGYPGTDLRELLARIIGAAAQSPRYGVPSWADATDRTLDDDSYTQPAPTGAPYTKPVAVLVGPWTQSSAENIVMLMLQRPDLITVGRQTSGSNGNITSVVLPGGFGMSFTGMRVKYADGSQFHGVGVTIDRPSAPSVQDYAAGIDRELADGIAAVTGT